MRAFIVLTGLMVTTADPATAQAANGFLIGRDVPSVLSGTLVATCEPDEGCELLPTYIVVPGAFIGVGVAFGERLTSDTGLSFRLLVEDSPGAVFVRRNQLGHPLMTTGLVQQRQPQQQAAKRSWIRRHPVLAGTLMGAGVGAVFYGATCNSYFEERNCDSRGDRAAIAAFGAGAGAFWGVVIGWPVS
jgi:hypothetical protein